MLLTLPRELRLSIYEFLFADVRKVVIGYPSDLPWQGRPRAMHPAIAAVSRQLRDETLPIFYRNKDIVLVLRYREGRVQIQDWLKYVAADPTLCKYFQYVSIQYFEASHRSTAIRLDVKTRRVLDRGWWCHAITGVPLKLFDEVKTVVTRNQTNATQDERTVADLIEEVVQVMMCRVQNTKLSQMESMASSRLHGYSDFQLRFEVMSLMYDA